MTIRSTAMVAASLLFSGVMLASCARVSKDLSPGTLTVQTLEQTGETQGRLKEIQKTLEDLEHRMASVESLEHRIVALEQPGTPGPKNTTSFHGKKGQAVSGEPILLYNKARSLLLEENFHGAAQLFKDFVTQYPESELADNALYWLGECHYSLGDFQKAIQTFKDVVTLYPRGGKVPDALLKTAYAYLSLDDADRAHHYLKRVVKGYPFTPAGEKAEQKLKAFQ